jgi:hypothetical protein
LSGIHSRRGRCSIRVGRDVVGRVDGRRECG